MKKILSIILCCVVTSALCAQTTDGGVILTEIMYDTPDNEDTGNGLPYSNGEFIELYNTSDTEISLAGWTLHAANEVHTFGQSARIGGKRYKIVAFCHSDTPEYLLNDIYSGINDSRIYDDVFYQKTLVLPNTQTSVVLKDDRGLVRDSLCYDGESEMAQGAYRLAAPNADHRSGIECLSLQRRVYRLRSDGTAVFDKTEWAAATVTPFETAPPVAPATDKVDNYIKIRTYTSDHGWYYTDKTEYYDGLGYLEQEVLHEITPARKDHIILHEYDHADREVRRWLPVVTDRSEPLSSAQIKDLACGCTNYNDPSPFVETRYESGSSDRVRARIKAGQLFRGDDKKQSIICNVNGQGEQIQHFIVNQSDTCAQRIGRYPDGALLKEITTDEDGNTRISYTDQLGRMVYTQTMPLKTSTYYIYDGLSRLRMIIPAECFDQMPGRAVIDPSLEAIRQKGYYYRYDRYGNLMEKQSPGKEREYYVHNVCNNNLVLWQDGNLRKKNQWIYTVYDNLNRVFEKRLVRCDKPWKELHDLVATSPFRVKMNIAPLHDNNYVEQAATTLKVIYQARYDGSSHTAPLADLPFQPVQNMLPADVLARKIGAKIYEKCLVLDASAAQRYVERAFYYDKEGNVVQTVEKNHLGGLSRTSTGYDFLGKPIVSYEEVQPGPEALVYGKKVIYSYDPNQRLIAEETVLNNGAETLVRYEYDELGRLARKIYGPGALTEQYEYNMQGWETARTSPLFEMKLRYFDPQYDARASYTGNITQWDWQHKDAGSPDGSRYAYTFAYDPLSRLVDGKQFIDGAYRDERVESAVTYDLRGNILTLDRKEGPDMQKRLTCSYSGNRLRSVSGSQAFGYDANGNMTHHATRNLDVTYNHLNLVESVGRRGTTYANYRYLCDGTKLSVADASGNGYEYLGSMIFRRSGTKLYLESTPFGGGRFVTPENEPMQPFYYLTDYLGSTRVVVDDAGNVRQRNDYYAFGKRWDDSDLSDNRFLYNGKEKQVVGALGFADYGARMYDDEMGRWFVTDPLAEKYVETSPYAFCANNPIRYIDHNGKEYADGKYFDIHGNYIASDNIDDDRVYIVTQNAVNKYMFEALKSDDYNAMKILQEAAQEIDGLIVVKRTNKEATYTQGEFTAHGKHGFSGYTMERPGPPSTESGKNKPIPYGFYSTTPRKEGDYAGGFAFRIFNDDVSIYRGILGHIGNKAMDSSGCVLFGLELPLEFKISRSKDAMAQFRTFYEGKGDVKLIVR